MGIAWRTLAQRVSAHKSARARACAAATAHWAGATAGEPECAEVRQVMRQRASGSGHQAVGIRQRAGSGRRRQRPHHQCAELGGCTVATVADGGIANGHPEGPMTGRKIAKSPRDPLRQRRSPEKVFLILSHLFTVWERSENFSPRGQGAAR